MYEIELNGVQRQFRSIIHWTAPFFCNMNCHYCFNSEVKRDAQPSIFPVGRVRETVDRLDQTFYFTLCGGGEWFAIKDSLGIFGLLLENHLVSMNSNMVVMNSSKLEDLIKKGNWGNLVNIHASCHIEELERLNLVDRFVANFNAFHGAGVRIRAQACFHPNLFNRSEQIVERFEKKGLILFWTKFVGEHNGKRYPEAYQERELTIMRQQRRSSMEAYPDTDGMLTPEMKISRYVIESSGVVIKERPRKSVGHILEGINI